VVEHAPLSSCSPRPAGGDEGPEDELAGLRIGDEGADFFDDADVLVAHGHCAFDDLDAARTMTLGLTEW
jgi:hypothetical protein